MTIKNDSPCHGCTDRVIEPNCHDICKKYSKWKAKQEEYRKKRKAKSDYNCFKADAVSHMQRRVGKR